MPRKPRRSRPETSCASQDSRRGGVAPSSSPDDSTTVLEAGNLVNIRESHRSQLARRKPPCGQHIALRIRIFLLPHPLRKPFLALRGFLADSSPTRRLVAAKNILSLLPNTNGRMEGDERLLKDQRDEPAANSLHCTGVELHQVLTFKVDKASLNLPICVKDSQNGRRKCARTGSRFTQYRSRKDPQPQGAVSCEARVLLLRLMLFELG